MGNRYIVSLDNFTPVAGNDIFTAVSAASRRLRLLQCVMTGLGAASAAQRIRIMRASVAGVTPGALIVPDKFEHTDQPAAAFTVPTTWVTQPVVATNTLPVGWNSLGGALIWNAPQGGNKMECRNGENLSFRAVAGVLALQNISFAAIIEED
jgi:hypothetical protein